MKLLNIDFQHTNCFLFFSISLLLSLGLSFSLGFAFNLFDIKINFPFDEEMKNMSFNEKVIIFAIIIPIIETLIFQYGIIKSLQMTFLRNYNWVLIIASALLFGVSHTYHTLYAFMMFLIGIVWAYSFIFYQSRKLPAFWIIAIIHGILNLVAISTKL